jgi:hypothetical protein
MKTGLTKQLTIQPFESLSANGLPPAPPPLLETEPAHRRLARLNRDAARVTEALQQLRQEWANKNIRAQATRTPISTPEITHVEKRRRELAGELLRIQTEIGATNKAIRERKSEGAARNSERAAPLKAGTKTKKCPLKEHPAFDQYFRLAAENELEASLYDQIEAVAKAMLSDALRNGLESP